MLLACERPSPLPESQSAAAARASSAPSGQGKRQRAVSTVEDKDPNPEKEVVRESDVYTPEDERRNRRFGLVCSKRRSGHGCVTVEGEEAVPFIYRVKLRFSRAGFALVQKADGGWVYVDSTHSATWSAETVEGMPDEYYQEVSGMRVLARFVKGGKVGYIDPERGVVIPAQYDVGLLFSNGKALVCVGCHPLRWSVEAPPEAACTGEAFHIDETGKRLEGKAEWDGPEECGRWR